MKMLNTLDGKMVDTISLVQNKEYEEDNEH